MPSQIEDKKLLPLATEPLIYQAPPPTPFTPGQHKFTEPRVVYTLVRHSGWKEGANQQFENAVEERSVRVAMSRRITAIGGLVFDDYKDAYDAALAYNYPPGHSGIIPMAVGNFEKSTGDVMYLFIPSDPELWTKNKPRE